MMDDREQRGLALAALYRIEQKDGVWIVPSQSGNGETYTVDPVKRHCTCRDHGDRAIKCKHMFAVEFVQTRERVIEADGSETLTVTETFKITQKVTYKQDWPAYNKAQTNEKRHFLEILADLTRGIPTPPDDHPKGGRPSLPRSDMLFSMAYKVYSTVSSRRFMFDLTDAAERGFISKGPHYNSVIKSFDNADLTPILKALIVESSLPLKSVETAIAIDSSGFSTCRFVRWFDVKYGKTMEEREWVKVHVATGVKTNVITAVEILDMHTNDGPVMPALLETTAQNFAIKEVSADKAYSSLANMEAIATVGATPFVAFKENATGAVGGLFSKAFHYYNAFRDDFLAHYHKRSNVESTFSMVKAKFGDSIRSKTDTAMINEALCKLLCHNICCLIQSIYELGIVATFWGESEKPDEPIEVAEAGTMDDVEAWAWV